MHETDPLLRVSTCPYICTGWTKFQVGWGEWWKTLKQYSREETARKLIWFASLRHVTTMIASINVLRSATFPHKVVACWVHRNFGGVIHGFSAWRSLPGVTKSLCLAAFVCWTNWMLGRYSSTMWFSFDVSCHTVSLPYIASYFHEWGLPIFEDFVVANPWPYHVGCSRSPGWSSCGSVWKCCYFMNFVNWKTHRRCIPLV